MIASRRRRLPSNVCGSLADVVADHVEVGLVTATVLVKSLPFGLRLSLVLGLGSSLVLVDERCPHAFLSSLAATV